MCGGHESECDSPGQPFEQSPRGSPGQRTSRWLFLYALRRIFTGHDFEFVRSGNAALERIESGVRYDVILLDLTMPQMSGMRVYAELMRIDPAQAARVIFITGGVLTSDAQRFLDEVPNLQLHKPFDAGELRAMVHKQRTG